MSQPQSGRESIQKLDLNAALGIASVPLDTSKAGTYKYTFHSIADSNYYADKHQPQILLSQVVRSRPTATFANVGKVYSYCATNDSGDDTIPIILAGKPPFALDLDIQYSGSAVP